MSALLYRLGRTCYRSRRVVVLVWLAIAALVAGLAVGVGGKFDDTFSIPGAPSQVALDQLKMTFPQAADLSATMLVVVPEGEKVTAAPIRTRIEKALRDLEDIPFVTAVQSPYNEHIEGLVSADGRAAYVGIRVEGTISTFTDEQRTTLNDAGARLQADLPGSAIHLGGEAYSVELPKPGRTEVVGLLVALLVLRLTLGSIRAALKPIVSGVLGAALALMVILISANLVAINSTTAMLSLMLALAVGMDYSLFILSRHRDQLGTGLDPEESTGRAVATAGSAVVFAGATVVIALVGMVVVGIPFLSVMGLFAALAVLIEVALALTLLPALIGFAGDRLRPRRRSQAAAPGRGSHRTAHRWVRVVTRFPLVTVLITVVALGALAIPAKDLQLALPNSGRHQPAVQDRITYDLISQYFGIGYNGPLIVTADIVESTDPKSIVSGLKDDVAAVPGVAKVLLAAPNPNADTLMVQLIPTTGPDDPATYQLVDRLRAKEPEWRERHGVHTDVTGFTAINIDVSERLGAALLPFGLLVVGLSLVLLTLVLRSIWVPVKAALGYVLSVGGAFGATTLVFNQGKGGWLVNLAEPLPVVSFLPLLVMGILFGLAMDYEMFLVTRMREAYVHGNRTTSVAEGFAHSAKVVLAAAVIMFAVFAFFVPESTGPIKPIAFSLAVGVALDAFVVRMTLGPAVMKLLGRHAWWLPRALARRMPLLDVEGESLAHQIRQRGWPEHDHPWLVYAQGLRAVHEDLVLIEGLDLAVLPGQVLAVKGDEASRMALHLGLGGRLAFTSGEATVLGFVLPEEGPAVRRRVDIVLASSEHFLRDLHRSTGRLVVIDGLHHLRARHREEVVRFVTRLREDGSRSVVLGSTADFDVAAIAMPDTEIVLHPSMANGNGRGKGRPDQIERPPDHTGGSALLAPARAVTEEMTN